MAHSLQGLYFLVLPVHSDTYVPCRFGCYVDIQPGTKGFPTITTASFRTNQGSVLLLPATSNVPGNILYIPTPPEPHVTLDANKMFREAHPAAAKEGDSNFQADISFVQPITGAAIAVKIWFESSAGVTLLHIDLA